MSKTGSITFLDSSSNQAVGHTPSGGVESGEVCIPNISMRERRKRLTSGVIMLAISLAILAVFMVTGTGRWWRLILFLPLAGAAAGFFQWRDKT